MKHLLQHILFLTVFLAFFGNSQAQYSPEFLGRIYNSWVDSTLQQMTLDQKIGQLFIVQAYTDENEKADELLDMIEKYQVGGVIFMQGTAARQVNLTNQIQQASKIPLLITMDGEWGLGFRLKDGFKYPVQMALGAIEDDTLIYEMGKEIGQQMKRIGVHVNFAPVADVNNNPDNPVINYRSFGEDPEAVARKAWLYAQGMQDVGVLAVAKHFPGHGDTETDSHLGLPVITHDTTRLDSVELRPFKYLIKKGIGGIMTAHLQVRALEPNKKIPASLSQKIIKEKLIGEYGYNGLIVTDGMNMSGVTDQFDSGKASVLALQAGNDMLEIVPNLPEAIEAIKKALQKGDLRESEIDWKCRKILALKSWLGLDSFKPISTDNLYNDLHQTQFQLTKRLLHEKSITVLKNKSDLIPLQKLDTLKIAVVSIGTNKETAFQRMAANYMDVDFFNLKEQATPAEISRLSTELKSYNLLICGIHGMNLSPSKQYGIDSSIGEFLQKNSSKKRIVALFGNPYALNLIPGIENTESLLVTYQGNTITQELAAQTIFGGVSSDGKLPVNVNSLFKLKDGVPVKKNDRLKYTIPEELGISSSYLEHRIDSLAELGIKEKAYPGCQVLIAIEGKVIFHKCYGFLTYDQVDSVRKDHIYDWASITKVTGPLPALIKLYGEHKFNPDIPFSVYWPPFRGTDKEKITSREILAHQSRLPAYIIFWQNTIKSNGELSSSIFKNKPTNRFNVRISPHLYMKHDYSGKMFDEIRDAQLLPRARYTYSGLAFYLFPQIIKDLSGTDYETYLDRNFYQPLGASSVGFNPQKRFPLQRFVPTEYDDSFRHELMQGYVHDEGASMMGGVSGNAGLFGTANDLAKVAEMYLQNGYYGGEQVLDSASLAEFTRIQYPGNENRRGLGFDKPYIDNYKNKLKDAYPAVDSSPSSFGHSGFTGTFFWADPVNKSLFIFFSNRVYPTRNNSKLFDLNIRPAMHQVIYDSLKHQPRNY